MRRREFISLLGGAATAWPLAVRAQQPGSPVLGYFSSRSATAAPSLVAAFRRGLNEAGYVEGQNVTIEYRWADEQYDRLPELVRDFVSRQVTVIVADGTTAAFAAKAGTSTIPIVFQSAIDPVASGLVGSINRPGGNVTGVTSLNIELAPKRLEAIREMLPMASVIATLINPNFPGAEAQSRGLMVAARMLGVELHLLYASTVHDIEAAFVSLLESRAQALVINADAFFISRIEQLAALALRNLIPAIHTVRDFALEGGLMSYGGSLVDQFRTVGAYAGRILRGETPANLPVQQMTKVELIINIKTAKLLGLTVPLSLLGRADEVIE